MQKKEEEKNRIRFRAVLLGFVMAVAICALTPFNNIYRNATPLGGGHFPLAPFFILVWLTVLVAVLRKIFKGRRWLTGKELLLAWVMMVLVSGIAYTGLARTFFVNLTAPYHFATVENHWQEILHPLLPAAWYPQSADAIEGIYNGLAGGRQMGWMGVLARIPWAAWLPPLLLWSGFVLLCYFVMVCVINLFSQQWIDNERMNFPLLQVPQLIEDALDSEGLGGLLTHRFLIAGIMIPVFLHLLNGLHFYYPDVPEVPTLVLAGPYFPKYGLFSGFQKLKIYIYPAFIGFAFLTSKQVSFSFWVFFLLGGLLIGLLSMLGYDIPAAALGVMFGPTLSRPEEMQMIGAYGVFFLFLLWLARHHLLQVLRQALGAGNDLAAENGWLSIRLSFWGAATGLAGIIGWCYYFGLPLLPAVLLVGAFFMVLFVATRVICQGGVAYFTLTVAPTDGLLAFFGPRFFTDLGVLVAGVVQKVLFVDLREALMPSLLHAQKITQKMAGRRMIVISLLLTLLAGVIVSFIAMLALSYKFGMRELRLDWETRTTVAVYENIYSLIESPAGSSHWVLLFIAAGAVVMLVLVTCYHRCYWWPIHPIGYLTAYSSAARTLWFSFLLGWLFNALCMRYGGVVLFKQLRFFFVGFIVGDFLMGGAWALVGLFADASYLVLPR
ncbi:MAG: hypothetical protein Q8P24_05515 [Desulfobacterales bacterium]|nr:hypothetical protein [Desulfobacterales bacterium]